MHGSHLSEIIDVSEQKSEKINIQEVKSWLSTSDVHKHFRKDQNFHVKVFN